MDLIQKAIKIGFIPKNKEYYLWELQKWLREVHNIHFEIKPIFDVTDNLKPYHINVIKNPSGKGFEYRIVGAFNTYEETLEIGLQEALELIK
jgi:hypothetical protein